MHSNDPVELANTLICNRLTSPSQWHPSHRGTVSRLQEEEGAPARAQDDW